MHNGGLHLFVPHCYTGVCSKDDNLYYMPSQANFTHPIAWIPKGAQMRYQSIQSDFHKHTQLNPSSPRPWRYNFKVDIILKLILFKTKLFVLPMLHSYLPIQSHIEGANCIKSGAFQSPFNILASSENHGFVLFLSNITKNGKTHTAGQAQLLVGFIHTGCYRDNRSFEWFNDIILLKFHLLLKSKHCSRHNWECCWAEHITNSSGCWQNSSFQKGVWLLRNKFTLHFYWSYYSLLLAVQPNKWL